LKDFYYINFSHFRAHKENNAKSADLPIDIIKKRAVFIVWHSESNALTDLVTQTRNVCRYGKWRGKRDVRNGPNGTTDLGLVVHFVG
jgi:hypothetical protein